MTAAYVILSEAVQRLCERIFRHVERSIGHRVVIGFSCLEKKAEKFQRWMTR